MSFTYINPRSIPKGGTHEETPRGGNWLSHKFSNTSAFTNKTRFILLVGIPRFLKHNLNWKKMFVLLCKKKWAGFMKMQPCRILWFLMKVKPKTKNKFFSRHITIYDKRSLGTFPSKPTQTKYYWLIFLTIYSIVLSKLLKNWAALLSSLCVDTWNKLSRWYQPLCVMVLYTFREEGWSFQSLNWKKSDIYFHHQRTQSASK